MSLWRCFFIKAFRALIIRSAQLLQALPGWMKVFVSDKVQSFRNAYTLTYLHYHHVRHLSAFLSATSWSYGCTVQVVCMLQLQVILCFVLMFFTRYASTVTW